MKTFVCAAALLAGLFVAGGQGARADDIVVGWSADIPQSDIKGNLSGYECREFPRGCPANSLMLDGDGQFQGCTRSLLGNCNDKCSVCEGSTYAAQLCVAAPTKECGSTGSDVDCGKIYYGSCVNPVTPTPAGTYHLPGGTCDCSMPTPPVRSADPCKLRQCLL